MKENYQSAWNEEVTECCGVPPKHGGGYPDYYKKCPTCGDGTLYWPAKTKFIYHPSSYEQELEDRIKVLEEELNRVGTKEKGIAK